MTHEDYCALLGDKDVAIYLRNKEIESLQAHLAEQTKTSELLLARVADLESRIMEQEAVIDKFSHHEPTPSLSMAPRSRKK